ncbi:adamts a disintegrin and metalloprotease with thrombospondin motifs protease [Holotrichia oblita]|uniref:Adamts a disintegrin and metalloprotease with thrombospondin motifs protease n=1 Tax=Holotrichia oblita TaxID=644536 RepID=A0ACB9TP05_HOLOL|nr:adamts a disintegrin and metalloprotease with thrombospondin motifs protease [Holotrichia oblita]
MAVKIIFIVLGLILYIKFTTSQNSDGDKNIDFKTILSLINAAEPISPEENNSAQPDEDEGDETEEEGSGELQVTSVLDAFRPKKLLLPQIEVLRLVESFLRLKGYKYSFTYPILINIEQPSRGFAVRGMLQLLIDSSIFQGNFTLYPIQTQKLLSPNFVYLNSYTNESHIIPHRNLDLECFYQSTSTALNLCDGVHGLLHSNENEYFIIHPLPKRFRNNSSQPHLLIRKPVHNMNKNVKRSNTNAKLQGIDSSFDYRYSKRKTKANRKQKHTKRPEFYTKESFHLNKTKTNSRKRLKRETFPEGSPVFVETAVFVDRDLFDHMITNFPVDTERELIRFVLAMINAVSLAPVAGMCTLTSSCTVNEGRHFESVYVVAHEIGHNTIQSRCLLDHGSSAGQLDHSAEGDLPGERFDADQQCMLKYGRGSRHSSQQPLDDVCRDLHCERERYTWTSHPALEGTSCGHNLWCKGGRCITKGPTTNSAYRTSQTSLARMEALNGGWSKWRQFSDCASGCLYGEEGRLRTGSAGIMVTTRLCNNPRPQGSGSKCEGHDKKYQTCNAKQCLNVPKLTIREFSEQICTRAKEVDKELTGIGSQRISTDNEEACMVWCHTRNGGTKSRGWTFPDGTACQTKRNRYGKPSYCINGKCIDFHCDIYDEEQYVLQSELCPNINKEENEIIWKTGLRRKDYNVQWVSASGCHFNCMSPGSGIRLVVRKNKKGRSSIQLCHPDQYGCGRIKSPFQHASLVCTKYREKVRRLSGLGMQISPAVEDPDRPCRVACQDETIPHRFYLVNGEDGWFPFGTDCAKGTANKKAYCISGKCLEFGTDDTPLSQTEFTLPLLSRNKRSLHNNSTRITATLQQQELDDIINKLNATISGQQSIKSQEFNIDLSNPIHVNMDIDMERISPHNYYKSAQDDYYNYT